MEDTLPTYPDKCECGGNFWVLPDKIHHFRDHIGEPGHGADISDLDEETLLWWEDNRNECHARAVFINTLATATGSSAEDVISNLNL